MESSQDSTGLTPVRPRDQLYKVALPNDNGQELHRLFYLPLSPLAIGNSDVSDCVNGELLKPANTRKMRRNLAADAPVQKWATAAPAANVSVTLKLWQGNKVINTVSTNAAVSDWTKVYEAAVPPELKEVRHFDLSGLHLLHY
jgi:hypothetical protein